MSRVIGGGLLLFGLVFAAGALLLARHDRLDRAMVGVGGVLIAVGLALVTR